MQNTSIHSKDSDSGSYQRRMAELLLGTMSRSDAAQYCLENGWEGALRFILHAAHPAPHRSLSE